MPTFRVKKLESDAIIPTRAHNTDSGLDLYTHKYVLIEPNTHRLITLGISVEIPSGYGGFIQPRSGLALKSGITVLNSPGLIDSGYRGEVGVILYNISDTIVFFQPGDRIAQLVIISTPLFEPIEVQELNKTKREKGGFGSTDEKGIDRTRTTNA